MAQNGGVIQVLKRECDGECLWTATPRTLFRMRGRFYEVLRYYATTETKLARGNILVELLVEAVT